ncbi:DNA repair protein rhp57 [Malassezia brasiliensis]|uniref:DNA repair protein rhp57 n=1 Tax=Malassezia brasiliensis TaxID=1821822 RepID=A0AAF0DW29_9BASI|nr:DNA repair protein rhp57 [Malassezia brasiliensis]
MHGALVSDVASLGARDKALCRRAGLHSVEQVLIKPRADLARRLAVSEDHAARIRSAIQRAAVPPMHCVWDTLHTDTTTSTVVPGTPRADEPGPSPVGPAAPTPAQAYLSTGVASLDACLGGGYARGMVSELLGESAAGKTQLLLYTAVHTALALNTPDSVALGGQGRGVALITTHGRSAARHMVQRMVTMAHACLQDVLGARADATSLAQAMRTMLRNVTIACAFTFESAQHVLCYTLPGLLERTHTHQRDAHDPPPIALVVLDSVPPLLQDDSLQEEEPRSATAAHTLRAARLHALAEWLRRIAAGAHASDAATTRPLAVVVVNHVSDAFEHDQALVRHAHALRTSEDTAFSPRYAPDPAHLLPLPYATQAAHFSGLLASVQRGDDALKTAQLGLVWANCVNARFLVSHTPQRGTARRLAVVFAPHAPAGHAAYFAITPRGIEPCVAGAPFIQNAL